MKVKIGDQWHDITPEQIELGENQLLIDKTNPPAGFFTQEALDQKITQRLSKEADRVKSQLKEDKDFHKEVFGRYNVVLDDDGKPKGLKPDFDPDKWMASKAKELTEPLQNQLKEAQTKYERAKKARIEDAILAATKGLYKEEFTKAMDGGRVKPMVVTQFRELFDEDDNGVIALKDSDGHGFAVGPNGQRLTVDQYLADQNKFGSYMMDQRQRGSGYGDPGGSGSKKFWTKKELESMSEADYAKNREEIMKAGAEGRVEK